MIVKLCEYQTNENSVKTMKCVIARILMPEKCLTDVCSIYFLILMNFAAFDHPILVRKRWFSSFSARAPNLVMLKFYSVTVCTAAIVMP